MNNKPETGAASQPQKQPENNEEKIMAAYLELGTLLRGDTPESKAKFDAEMDKALAQDLKKAEEYIAVLKKQIVLRNIMKNTKKT